MRKDTGGGYKLVVFGCGGHARSIINTIFEFDFDLNILLVDEHVHENEVILNCKTERRYELKDNDRYIVAVGDNTKRKMIYESMLSNGIGKCISIVSLYSNIGINVNIGRGTFIAPNSYIGPLVEIGCNTIINTGSIIEHDVKIGNNVHIAPKATICGSSVIGDNVFCGTGSTIIDKISVCNDVIVGAGAVVIENIIIPGTYVGVPAKKIN